MMNDLETKKVEKILDYSFNDKNLLNRALTRKAYAKELGEKHRNQDYEDQEVLCTLGDAVLKAVLVDLLIESGCKTSEKITIEKKGLESKEALANICQDLGIGPFIKLGVGEEKQKVNEEQSVLAETLEALIGAIYLDGGYSASKEGKGLSGDHTGKKAIYLDGGYSASKKFVTKWWDIAPFGRNVVYARNDKSI